MRNKFIKKIFVFTFSCLFVLWQGCATAPRIPPQPVGETSLKDLCRSYNVSWDWDSVSRLVTLTDGRISARILVGSDIVLVENQRIALCEPVRIVGSQILVPLDFQAKVMAYFVSRENSCKVPTPSFNKIKTIVVDAGHGGKDPGAMSHRGLREKEVVLDIALRLAKILKNYGYHVILTRKDDTFISLKERTEIASRANADLFISIHANSSPSRRAYGLEIYTLKDLSYSDKKEDQRLRNYYLLYQKLNMEKTNSDVKNMIQDILYNNKQYESELLAARIAANSTKYLNTKDRGLKKARFFVLRNTLIPAVLVEIGFLSNTREEKLMRTRTYRQKIAHSIARGVLDYSGK